ncbi:GDYXXLXY domain-containing protein [Caenispirillum bisanense]|uniref:GDYXXLXY domain-containing protein n=1 Tax=Caenispirillum bisanense TaxID=414052 RepID=UPI0031DF2AFB
MRPSLGVRIGGVVAAMLAVLVVMVVMRQWPLVTGQEVVLPTEPVDPRSLLRGDYVDLGYAVSRLSEATLPLPEVTVGATVYVPLTGPDADGHWHPAGVMLVPPLGPVPFLRGRVTSAWVELPPGAGQPEDDDAAAPGAEAAAEAPPAAVAEAPAGRRGAACQPDSCRVITVRYGIESYFVPEDTGRDLEDLVREGGRLAVAVAVDSRGRAVIAGLVVDGERVSWEGLF